MRTALVASMVLLVVLNPGSLAAEQTGAAMTAASSAIGVRAPGVSSFVRNACRLSSAEIEGEVVDLLRAAGVPAVNAKDGPGGPELRITVEANEPADGAAAAYFVAVEFFEDARLERDPSQGASALMWRNSFLASRKADSLCSAVHEKLVDEVRLAGAKIASAKQTGEKGTPSEPR